MPDQNKDQSQSAAASASKSKQERSSSQPVIMSGVVMGSNAAFKQSNVRPRKRAIGIKSRLPDVEELPENVRVSSYITALERHMPRGSYKKQRQNSVASLLPYQLNARNQLAANSFEAADNKGVSYINSGFSNQSPMACLRPGPKVSENKVEDETSVAPDAAEKSVAGTSPSRAPSASDAAVGNSAGAAAAASSRKEKAVHADDSRSDSDDLDDLFSDMPSVDELFTEGGNIIIDRDVLDSVARGMRSAFSTFSDLMSQCCDAFEEAESFDFKDIEGEPEDDDDVYEAEGAAAGAAAGATAGAATGAAGTEAAGTDAGTGDDHGGMSAAAVDAEKKKLMVAASGVMYECAQLINDSINKHHSIDGVYQTILTVWKELLDRRVEVLGSDIDEEILKLQKSVAEALASVGRVSHKDSTAAPNTGVAETASTAENIQAQAKSRRADPVVINPIDTLEQLFIQTRARAEARRAYKKAQSRESVIVGLDGRPIQRRGGRPGIEERAIRARSRGRIINAKAVTFKDYSKGELLASSQLKLLPDSVMAVLAKKAPYSELEQLVRDRMLPFGTEFESVCPEFDLSSSHDHRLMFRVELEAIKICPECGKRSFKVLDTRLVCLHHAPIAACETYVVYTQSRYLCFNCQNKIVRETPFRFGCEDVTVDFVRAVLLLAVNHGLSYSRVADYLKVDSSKVKHLIHMVLPELELPRTRMAADPEFVVQDAVAAAVQRLQPQVDAMWEQEPARGVFLVPPIEVPLTRNRY